MTRGLGREMRLPSLRQRMRYCAILSALVPAKWLKKLFWTNNILNCLSFDGFKNPSLKIHWDWFFLEAVLRDFFLIWLDLIETLNKLLLYSYDEPISLLYQCWNIIYRKSLLRENITSLNSVHIPFRLVPVTLVLMRALTLHGT